MNLKFEWDELKDEFNMYSHGLSFLEAQTVWTDVASIEFYDQYHSLNEQRWIRLVYSSFGNLLFVVFTEPDLDIIRIISARKATSPERKLYEG